MWNEQHQLYPYQREAAEAMVESDVLLAYDMGCLAGDTVIDLNRGGKGFKMRIDLLVERQTDGMWRSEIPTLVARNVDGVRRLGRLEKAWFSGVKQTYELCTIEGRRIRATDEHPFLTTDGWARMDQLCPGDQVLVDAGRSKKGRTEPKAQYRQTFGMANHPYRAWWARRWAVPTHRIVFEAGMNGTDIDTFLAEIRAGHVEGLAFLDPMYAVHHINHDPLDNRLENLMVLTHSEHHALHAREGKDRYVLHQIGHETVRWVHERKEEPTYDIEVEDDPHNFLANGFVVHNTGKTPTTLFALERMRGEGFEGPGTVLVPASLKWQWRYEIERFTDQKAMVIDGTPSVRKAQYADVKRGGYGYVVMTYDMYRRDWGHHVGIADGFLVLDEATAIKQYDSLRSKHIKANRHRYAIKYALTGTPIENGKAEEIFAIMEFVDPKLLGKFWEFQARYIDRNSYGAIIGYRNLDSFHRRLSPYVLRKAYTDPEVARHMPKVQYRPPVMVDLDKATRRTVDRIVSDILIHLDALADAVSLASVFDDEQHPDGVLMSKIQVLRMLLTSPGAVLESARKFDMDNGGSAYASEIVGEGLVTPSLGTPKMDKVLEYLIEHLSINDAYKAVVFSSFVEPAQMLDKRLEGKRIGSVLFTGAMSSQRKNEAVTRFRANPDVRVFVSTDAGGLGLDLPEANLLINLDLPWQAGMLKQRNARIRRASSIWGQVLVQDFIVRDSIEERMRVLLDHKSAVSEAIVDGTAELAAGGRIVSDLTSQREFLTNLEGGFRAA